MKLYRNLIAIFVLVASLALLLFFVTKIEPKTETPDTQEDTENSMFSIYKAKSEDVKRMNIKNADEEYFVAFENGRWTLNGDETVKVKESAIKSVVNACTAVSAKQLISDGGADGDAYGLSEPLGFVEVLYKDGTAKKILVGKKTLDGADYYIKLDDEPKIYLKNAFGTESMIPSSQSLRDLSLIAININDLNSIEHFHMFVDGKMPIKLENQTKASDGQKTQWKMVEPVYAEMNGQIFTQNVVNCFESINAVAVIEDHAKNMSNYGLQIPYARFSIGADGKTYAFSVGNKVDSYRYVKQDNKDTVYIVSESNLSFLNVAYVDLMSNLIHVEYISDVNNVKIVSNGTEYNMEIKGDSQDSEYFINGIKIKKDAFSKVYQAIIGISLERVDLSNEPNIPADSYIEYTKKDASKVRIAFLPVDDRNYRVVINGKGNSITNQKNFKNVLKKIQETIDASR